MSEVPTLNQMRRLAMEDALNRSFKGGKLQVEKHDPTNFFGVLLPETMFAALAAYEFADAAGPLDQMGHSRLVDGCTKLFADAAENISRSHDYLNPRAMEAVGALGLHRLTGDQAYMQRCVECLDELLTRQYPCGAQPYHTGHWVWGRSPSPVYQFLTANLMLYLGFELGRDDAVEYVRRVADYSLLATNRRAEAFCTTFEGLHKSGTLGCVGRQGPMAAALGDERFRPLARTTYEVWVRKVTALGEGCDEDTKMAAPKTGYLVALNEAQRLGLKEEPTGDPFVPRQGRHALADISTVFVHESGVDVSMSLLSGYSAFAEADCGDVKLFALTPELTDQPSHSHAGTHAMRYDWRVPSEQLECAECGGRTVLRGRVYTEYDKPRGERDESRVHNRLLEVTMSYADGEMILEYETLGDTLPEPVSSRLLFLLIARPPSASPRLQVGEELDTMPPPGESKETFFAKTAVATVRFEAPDGSAIEIVPELSTADCVTAERPPHRMVPWGPRQYGRKTALKPANEGSLRVAFDGVKALDRGRYRIRFLPA